MTAHGLATGAPDSIFILKPSSFGDVIHTLPAVARLRSRWPSARISWLVNPEWAPLLQGSSLVDEVVIFPRNELRGWRGLRRLPGWLRKQITWRRPTFAVDYQGLMRSALIGRFSRPNRLLGLADAREGARWLYDAASTSPPGVPHSVERYLALSEMIISNTAGAHVAPLDKEPHSYPLPAGETIKLGLPLQERFVLLHPFARGTAKSLTVAEVQRVCACLAPRQVVVVGKSQLPEANLPGNARNLLDQTSLLQLLWLIRQAAFVISVDSGPAHLAAALDKPLVSIHTWSDPRRVGPYKPEAWVLKNGKLLQMRSLGSQSESFFKQPPGDMLSAAQLEAICRLATSS